MLSFERLVPHITLLAFLPVLLHRKVPDTLYTTITPDEITPDEISGRITHITNTPKAFLGILAPSQIVTLSAPQRTQCMLHQPLTGDL